MNANANASEPLTIEVVYATQNKQRLLEVQVVAGTTAREAAENSGLSEQFPELDTATCPLGVFGETVADNYVLQESDRVELYRPLINEPRETRRRLAQRGETMGTRKLSSN